MRKKLTALSVVSLLLFTAIAAAGQSMNNAVVVPLPMQSSKAVADTIQQRRPAAFSCKPAALAVPAAMTLYGLISLNNRGLQQFNKTLKIDAGYKSPNRRVHIDNYLQFAPAVSVYVLDIAGIRGKHNLLDKTMLLFMTQLFTNAIVRPLKNTIRELRPDSSSYKSFPSGHTAAAFANAEFMWQEYKAVSPWYGAAGYAIAAATGWLRMYNNKHWFSDVVAGAGIGILSTKLAYWLYPCIQRRLFKNRPMRYSVFPSYQSNHFDIGLVRTL